MWALLKSPLILGHDLLNTVRFVSEAKRTLFIFALYFQSNETWTIVTNTEIIAINQDPNGQSGIRLWKRSPPEGGDLQLWRSELTNG
jgi:alpha-galactosidase